MNTRRLTRFVGGILGCISLTLGGWVLTVGPAGAVLTPPIVTTQPATGVGSTSATLNGTVNPNGLGTTYTFNYGTTTSYGFQAPTPAAMIGSGTTTTAVSATVLGLTPGTTYDFSIMATNANGHSNGVNLTFTTSGTAPAGSPTVATLPASAITSTSATLNGSVNPNGVATTYFFQYGTTTAYGTNTATLSAGAGTTAVAVFASIGGLTPGVTYDFQLVATNTNGTSLGGNQSFVAGGPAVVTTPATSVTSTSATLNGTVNPGGLATTYYFQYGPTTAYGTNTATQNAGSGTTAVAVFAVVTGLTPGVTYDFQLVAVNSSGTSVGGNQSFVAGTGGPPPTVLAGSDAIGTSIAISQAAFPLPGSAGSVVLVRDNFFSDGLAGGPLAASTGGSELLTQGADEANSIDVRTLNEMFRILPKGGTVYILGGNLAISSQVDGQLQFVGYVVVRLAGNNEFSTAVLVAQRMGNPTTIFEATGLGFADAESSVPAAIAVGAAILLTNGNVQAPETALYLLAHSSDVRYAIGGPLAAAGADPGAIAVFGADQFGTSAAVATRFFPGATVYGAATGFNYPDALVGGLFMATGGRFGPLLLVFPNPPLPPSIAAYLGTLATGTPGFIFGGPLAVSPLVGPALQQAVG